MRFGRLFGPVENRAEGPDHVSLVSNVLPDGSVMPPDTQRLKDLKANMLWHTDSTFLPVPALANIITARLVPSEGGATELVSTRAGFARLTDELKAVLRGAIRHRYSHSRAKIDPELATAEHIVKWPEQTWRGMWPNPVNGREAVYIASHACGIVGMDEANAQALIDRTVEALRRRRRLRAPLAGRRRADLGRTRHAPSRHALALRAGPHARLDLHLGHCSRRPGRGARADMT